VLRHCNIFFAPTLPGFVVNGLCVGLFSLRTLFTSENSMLGRTGCSVLHIFVLIIWFNFLCAFK
jgi:hypothetical protein